MTGDDVNKILERALADNGFLESLLADPAKAASELGAAMTPDEIATLNKMTVDEFKQFAAEYKTSTDPAKRRAAC